MSASKVLMKDKLSTVLAKYQTAVGQAVNQIQHRTKFKHDLQFNMDHHDEFYHETGLTNGRICWAYGLQEWMGHKDPLTGEKGDPNDHLVRYVHPLLREWYRYILMGLTLVYTERKVHYLSTRFSISMPMRHKSGEYHLVKQMAMVFGKDQKEQVASFINSFTIVEPYYGEPFDLQFFEGKKKVQEKERQSILSRLADHLDPCIGIDFSSGFSLSREDFIVLDIIKELGGRSRNRNIESIRKRFEKKTKKTVTTKAIDRRLDRLFIDLKWILGLDTGLITRRVDGKVKKYMPVIKDVFELADFLDRCGITYIIHKYLRKRNFPKAKKVKKT